LRASSREAGITLFPRHRCEQPLALDLQDVGHRKSIDGHAAIGSQTGTIIGIFRASGNAGREGERLLMARVDEAMSVNPLTAMLRKIGAWGPQGT
jgi:hypothetical protein